jgi:RHH-type proline utilization regulon transcriptional repressor/proline dehydrogenase/delta 1-pyrroline-5-carboxylate dehydrogenase
MSDQKLIQSKGEEILRRMEGANKISLFSKDFWYGSIMDWSMKNDQFKTNMFRFVDVLPSLNSGNDVAQHLKEYFSENGQELPSVFNVGLGLGSLAPGLMAGAIRKNVTQMAKMFITGENPDECLSVLKKTRKNKMTFTVDILGEATLSEKEALEYQSRYLELINGLAKEAKSWEEIPQIDRDHEGSIPKVNVSVKMTALYSQINDKSWDKTKSVLKERLRPLLQTAMLNHVFLNLDMEQYAVKDLTIEVFKELLMEPEFKNYKFFGCVIQAYLTDSSDDVKKLIQFAKERGTPLTVRLVKGAYWDYETVDSAQKNWPVPVYTQKAQSDANYEACAQLLLNAHQNIRVALASHNVRTLAAAMVHAESLQLPKESFEIQMLYGMAEPIKKSLVDMGYRVREYAPVGELIPGMAYLVRRLLENTSNESWLRGKFAEGQTTEILLQDPNLKIKTLAANTSTTKKLTEFENEALIDFAVASNRQKMTEALDKKRKLMGLTICPKINGQSVSPSQTMNRMNPSNSSEVVAKIGLSTIQDAEKAVQSATAAFKKWKKVSPFERAKILDKVADLMSQKRFDLMATQILEVGKPWAEADGDLAEAIDFCRYYANDARKIFNPQRVGHAPGETSHYIYQARGLTVVIAPWNFPLAILAGQVVSALVTGNPVIMKPAEQSSWVASELMDLLLEAGVPSDVLHFLPGLGEVVGEHLVNHPQTATIAFTGSKAVGLHILQRASIIHPGQNHVKRCIIEMGGKNALIIDTDADLDEAVDGVLYSAFGFSGQKCSAASRVLVLADIYDRFTERLVEAAKSLQVRAAHDPEAYLGPVVDQEAFDRILKTISESEKNHQLLFKAQVPQGGYFAPPTLFGPVPADSDLAQQEIFGPVVAVIKVKNIEEAVEKANQTEYALTAGVFSRSPANIQYVKDNLECGNMYINRGITGAMVDRHPFGGFKLSGVGSKTGGPDYLRQFVEPIVITENTLRRGFAPSEN